MIQLSGQDIIRESEGVLGRAHDLMGRTSHQNPAKKLRRLTLLRCKLINNTRWSSIHEMIKRYLQNQEFVTEVDLDEVSSSSSDQ